MQSGAVLSFEDYAAEVIQTWWRHLRRESGSDERAKRLRVPAKKKLTEEQAAFVIQRSWRKHSV